MRRPFFATLLLLLGLAAGTRSMHGAPAAPALPPLPPALKSPVDYFRQLLEAPVPERERLLSAKTPEHRRVLEKNLRLYERLRSIRKCCGP